MNFLARKSNALEVSSSEGLQKWLVYIFSLELKPIYLNFNQRQLCNHGEPERAACARQGDRCQQCGIGGGTRGDILRKGSRKN